MECIFIEINLYKKKWLIGGTYNPCKTMTTNHLNVLSKYIDHHLARYDNIIIMGDFNSKSTQLETQEFCELYNLKNLVKEPTCYKNPDNPSCIDLILTNRKNMFCKTATIETGLSFYENLTVTVMKTLKRIPKLYLTEIMNITLIQIFILNWKILYQNMKLIKYRMMNLLRFLWKRLINMLL